MTAAEHTAKAAETLAAAHVHINRNDDYVTETAMAMLTFSQAHALISIAYSLERLSDTLRSGIIRAEVQER